MIQFLTALSICCFSSLSESFFMVKGAALFLQQGSSPQGQKAHPHHKHAGDLPQHLQVMINILRFEDRIKLAVRLESAWSDRVRYMVVVYTSGRQDTEENILLGIDFSNKDSKSCSVGMVLPLWSDTKIHLDGDGGFSVNTVSRNHVFKPVSVQAMWSALQILHKVCEVSRRYNYFPGGMALTWMGFYESCISSEQSCINEWNAMRDLETLRPDSPTMFVDKPTERERTECLIKAKLRSIMMFQDLENVTSKQIRTELEQHMSCNLMQYKEFIDNEMLLILGQMDKATLIFDHLYLVSHLTTFSHPELVGYILNVTREIDNFFPGTFSYQNIRVYDEETTDLLAHWNETYNFIVKAKKNHSKCLVHCKMGVSRSASTVIAYAMKEYGWSLEKAYNFVKQKRSITRPNAGFMRQLAEYEGILDASKQRHNKLWRPDCPDPDCDLPEGQQAQCCGRSDPGNQTPEPVMSSCYEEALGEKGVAHPLSPCRMISLERVFIEIEDVERDALLDDEAFGGREGLTHFGQAGEGTAAQTCCRGPEPLEELRLRLEFSTVEEEDEEEAQKEEAEMEALAQPGGRRESARRGNGEGEVEMVQEEEGEKEGNGLDLVTLNQNSNNNNHFNTLSSLNVSVERADILEGESEGEEGKLLGVSEALLVSELLSLEKERPAVACSVAQQQETLVQLQRSGLVRRRAERLERLSGLSLEGLHPLELPETPSSGAREGTSPVEGRFSAFPGDFPKSSTPCSVRLEPLVVPLPNEALLGAVGSGGLTPTSSPHGSTLTRSSSSDSIRSVRGKPGLVRQRAQEIETRMRLAGLTVPSSLKRSNSLAKLGSLNFSSEDLCSICSSDAGTLLLRSLSPEPGREWECPTTSTSSSTSTFTSTHPRAQRDQTSPERALPGGGRS
uniref:Protein phosphatase Slingshot homolog 1 n=1 Tax=Oncorhynchus kisutch TaxID=8019 RepID=A0A8C7LHW6_ONCKI